MLYCVMVNGIIMFIERFFNPAIQNTNDNIFYRTKEALEYCKKHYSYIRHYSFKGNEYIKYDGENLIWNDGSKVDKRKLPKSTDGWGRYFSELHNRCSF
jgi:glutamine cyclotransferase